jgi:Ca-activated chloride channel family protein
MLFVRPLALFLLFLLVPLAWAHRRHRMDLGGLHAAAVLAIRLAALALLTLAIARPVMNRADPTRTRVAVVDISPSIEDADLESVGKSLVEMIAQAPANTTVKLVAFDRTAREVPLTESLLLPGALVRMRRASDARRPHPVSDGASAVADALELAGALIPRDGPGRIVLFSDGLETHGDARAAACRLGGRGIPISIQPVGGVSGRKSILQSVATPTAACIGETIPIRARIEASEPGQAQLEVRGLEGGEEVTTPLRLAAGSQEAACLFPLRTKGLQRIHVALKDQGSQSAENNILPAAVRVLPPRTIRVIETAPDRPATTALKAMLGTSADVSAMTPDDLSKPDALRRVDLLVLGDTPADQINQRNQQFIHQAVSEGKGLLVTGGRRSFGPGGYADTPLAEVLPVRFTQQVERRDPSATLVVIIDTSGSMGGPRVDLAKEIARLALRRLKPHDKAGIVEFYGSKRWAAPIQPASNAVDLQRALDRLNAGGGTVILPAIEEAYYALLNVRTRTRHVLVLTDGGVETGPFEPLIRKMADRGMTVSTVMVGPGTHSAFLASLAQWGRGKFYSSPDRFNLPEIIVKQPESSLLSPFIEEPTALVAEGHPAILEGIDLSKAPRIAGYVETDARPTADTVLRSSLGHPILATWQYGLGKVAAWTTHLGGEWSQDLARRPEFARLVSNLVRSLYGASNDRAFDIEARPRPAGLEIRIAARAGAGTDPFGAIDLALTDPDGRTVRSRKLDPIRPHEWNVLFADMPEGTYQVDVRAEGSESAAFAAAVVPPKREVERLNRDMDLLNDVRDISQRAAAKSGSNTRRFLRPVELWPVLAAAGLVLFLLNILIRRWPVDGLRYRGRAAVGLLFFSLLVRPAEAAKAQPTTRRRPMPSSAPARTTKAATTSAPILPPLSGQPIEAIDRAVTEADAARATSEFNLACRLVSEQYGDLSPLVEHLRVRARTDARAAKWLARAARLQGDLKLTQSTLADLAKNPKTPPDVWAELVQAAELLGKDADALKVIDSAIAEQTDAGIRFALLVRKAQLLYDRGDRKTGRAALKAALQAGQDGAAAATYGAHLASLCGDTEFAAATLKQPDQPGRNLSELLFRGLFLLRENRPAEAAVEFEQAYAAARLARDKRYALERIIDAARQAGALTDLANRWLTDETLSPDRLQALVGVLGEIGRSQDALRLLRRAPKTPGQRALVSSSEFQREVIAVAIDAGQTREAEESYRALVRQEPQEVQYRVGLARLLLLNGRRAEAELLFAEAVDRVSRADSLMELADAARRLALDDVALAAADKAGASGSGARVRALVFEADLARQRGQPDRAIEILGGLKTLAQDDPKVLVPVAEAFERYGDKAEALRLFRLLYDRTGSEDTLLRVAWLLEENERFDEAYLLWKELWQKTEVPARRNQAQVRLLDLGGKSGKLADLVIELEQNLDEGKGGEKELSLLVDIYTGANDAVSAAEILHEFGRRSGNQVGMLKRLATVYLNCEQFGRCNAILRKLADQDPANADDYLQQMAIVALERRQPVQAKAALAELAARAGSSDVVDEFTAGVLNLLGLSEEAARCYARSLARHPDRIEGFLLWGNAMKAAGQGDLAVARFQVLIETAAEDDLFAVAVDGLLNLGARPMVLQSALRRVRERIALNPDKVFLYRLAADLLEAMGRMSQATQVLEQSVVVAGERRGPLLRELMDGANADGKTEQAIAFGRMLMGLGEEVPPQVFIDLGEALIKTDQLAAANRVFRRASLEADFTAVQQRVARAYEAADMPERADRVIRELLIGQPDNVELLIFSGGLCEQMGDFPKAFEQYHRAAELMLLRLPTAVQTSQAATAPAKDSRRKQVQRSATNLDEMTQYFDSACNGLLNSARTTDLQARLVRELRDWTSREIESLGARRTAAASLKHNPRLDGLARFLRYVAFSVHDPEMADDIDRKLLALYRTDTGLLSEAVESRCEWGLYARASALAGKDQADPVSPPALMDRLLKDQERLRAFVTGGKVEPQVALRLLPTLIMTGQTDLARRLIGALKPHQTKPTDDVAKAIFASAVALEDHEAIAGWARASLDLCGKDRSGAGMAREIEQVLRLSWNFLTPDERSGLMQRIGELGVQLGSPGRTSVDLLRLRLADRAKIPLADRDEIIRSSLKDATLSADAVAELLALVQRGDRPATLEAVVAARKPEVQRQFLLSMVSDLNVPEDDLLTSTIEHAFRKAPKFRLRGESGYMGLTRVRWYQNPRLPRTGLKIAELLLSEQPEDPGVMTVVAVARHHGGRHTEAISLASEAIEAITSAKELKFDDERMLTDLGGIMSAADLAAAVGDLKTRQDLEGATAGLCYARAALLLAGNRSDEAITALQEAFRLAPEQTSISRRLILVMKEAGRNAELARLLSTHLTKSTIMQSYQWMTLAETYVSLGNLSEALKAARRLEGPLAPIHVMRIASMMGDHERIVKVLRRFLIQNRNERRFYSPFWPEPLSEGGMKGFLARPDSLKFNRDRIFAALAGEPFAEQEFACLLQSGAPGRHDIRGLAEGVVRAARLRGHTDRLIKELLDAYRRGAINAKDQLTIMLIAQDDPKAIPDELTGCLDRMLTQGESPDAEVLVTVARLHAAHGHVDRARAILGWVLASDRLEGRGSYREGGRFAHVDAYVATFPQAEQKDRLLRILRSLEPAPLDGPSESLDSTLLLRLADIADPAEVNQLVETMRGRLAGTSVSQSRQLRAAIAHLDARAGRFEPFQAMVAGIVEGASEFRYVRNPFDYRSLLPAAGRMKDPLQYIRAVVSCLDKAAGTRRLETGERVSAFCLLGQWCVQEGLKAEANRMLTRAEQAAGPLGGDWLWVADLAALVGQPAKAVDIQIRLLNAKLLPGPRIPGLLASVEATRTQEEADRLAAVAASFCDHPAVLQGAARQARREGKPDQVKVYESRLNRLSTRPATAEPPQNSGP